MNPARIVVSIVSVCVLFAACLAGCDSENQTADQTFTLPIQNEYPGLLGAAQEEEIAQTIELMNLLGYRATVLINSTLFADFYRTSPDVIKARGQAAITAIDDYNNAATYLINLENQYILPIVQALKMRKAQSGTGDLLHASRLIDLYMNDDAFYKKYKLSDIARRTGVSMTRLRMMMQQEVYEIETAGYVTEEEQYATAVRNCKAIRDTAVATEAVLVTVATGGAGAAGTLSTVQKTVKVIEGVNTVLSVAESGVAVVNAAIGTDNIPPVVDNIFKGNKVLSYLLLPKALMSGDAGSVVALMTPTDDATDWYFNVSTSTGTTTVSTKPNKTTSTARHKNRRDVLDDFLLPGDYQLPHSTLTAPTKSNSGFSFVEDPISDDDFMLDAVNMADLWDLPDAPQDTMSWNTEARNPDSSMEHVSSLGPDAATNPLAGDSLLFNPVLADPPAVTVTATPASGDAPLIITFSAQVSNPTGEALTYAWHFGDGGYEESALSYPDHTYTEAGTYRVTVYVKGARLGQLMGGITVTVSPGAVVPDGDVDTDIVPGGTCYTPAGIHCPGTNNAVQTGVVMCNPLYMVEQVCVEARSSISIFQEVKSCDDGNLLTWDSCSKAAADCSAHCEHEDWSGTTLQLTYDNCTSQYRDSRNQGDTWCIEDVNYDENGNPYFWPVQGIYTCNGESEIKLVAACPCYYDSTTTQGPQCRTGSPYPYR